MRFKPEHVSLRKSVQVRLELSLAQAAHDHLAANTALKGKAEILLLDLSERSGNPVGIISCYGLDSEQEHRVG